MSSTTTPWILQVHDSGPTRQSVQPDEVVLGLSPGFGQQFDQTPVRQRLGHLVARAVGDPRPAQRP